MKRKARRKMKAFWDLIILLSAILTIFISLPAPAMAKSITLTVTCSIPSIPGVNAPMLEGQSMTTAAADPAQSQATASAQNAAGSENPAAQPLPTIMQEETRQAQHPITPNAAAAPLLIQTLYLK